MNVLTNTLERGKKYNKILRVVLRSKIKEKKISK